MLMKTKSFILSLVQTTLEDGVLEENEKVALVNRTEREGVNLA